MMFELQTFIGDPAENELWKTILKLDQLEDPECDAVGTSESREQRTASSLSQVFHRRPRSRMADRAQARFPRASMGVRSS